MDNFGSLLEDCVKGFITATLIFIVIAVILTALITHSITKNNYSKEAIDKRAQYEKTLKELTPKQREVLGL